MPWYFFLGMLVGLLGAAVLIFLIQLYLAWLRRRDEVWRRWHYEKEEQLKTQDPYCMRPPPGSKDKYDHLGGW
jgi:hypothetical protein